MSRFVLLASLVILGPMVAGVAALAQSSVQPSALVHQSRAIHDIDWMEVSPVDLAAVAIEDQRRAELGLAPRYAVPYSVEINPDSNGTWEGIDAGFSMWRLRIVAPGAVSLNLGFSRYSMPEGARLMVSSSDYNHVMRPFTSRDNEDHGELWTPILRTDDLVVELTVPNSALGEVDLLLSQIGYGYRGFGTKGGVGPQSGGCNIDVVCPEGDAWRNEIPAIGVISTGGSTFCTGVMVNNTSYDRTPYFLTARHCGIRSSNAASLVVYWNYETSVCDGSPDGRLTDFNTGSYWRAEYNPSDFTLVELDDDPDPSFGVTFAGWDSGGDDATSAVAIHHPSTDEKRISFEDQPTATTSYLGGGSPGDGTHVRVGDWDLGTTEPGSSGSPLFDQNHHVIGQLHGGYAACGNDDSDWYGKFSVSWTGGGSSSSRLSNWLDAAGTGDIAVDTMGVTLMVVPAGEVVHSGPVGGPFTNPAVTYTLTNQTNASIDYEIALTISFGILLDGGTNPITGTLPPQGGTAQVEVSLGPDIYLLPSGGFFEVINFTDRTNSREQTRSHVVDVGRIRAYDFALDGDPGWSTEGQWSLGSPTGRGGEYGNSDPNSSHTGNNVYGYNLNGDYANDIPQYHLTSLPINCKGLSGVELRFWRWLNVEQPTYDHAYVRVSKNGSNWTTIWQNGSEITDNSWSEQSFDISNIADDEPSVYLRWTMGVTDGSWRYSGWNVDDIEVWGIPTGLFTPYGSGCPGGTGFVPELDGWGSATPGGRIHLDIADGLPSSQGLLFISTTQGAGCFLVGSPFYSPLVMPLDSAGSAALGGDIPGDAPADVHLFLQFIGLEPIGGWNSSNGMDIHIQ